MSLSDDITAMGAGSIVELAPGSLIERLEQLAKDLEAVADYLGASQARDTVVRLRDRGSHQTRDAVLVRGVPFSVQEFDPPRVSDELARSRRLNAVAVEEETARPDPDAARAV